MKILIADDERATREGLRAAILRFFPEAEILPLASNGIEALDIAYQMPPDILISDIQMPGMDGLEMLETLYEKTFDTEFVIVSAYDNFEYAKRAMKMGVRHYILKPCKDQEIQNVIKQALRDLGERRSLRLYIERMHVDTTETGLSGQLYTKNELVNKTLAFIQSNLDSTDLTINSLARNILFVRPDYLGKIFKREVGVKLSDYIRNKRIEHAKELLRNGNDRIYEISEKCGFGDNVQHFCYLFKFLTGYTPSQYRGNVSETEFVIVSAYDNFEYAKRAMKMGVRHYILKPCKDQEIQNVIKQALRDLGERRSLRLYIERMHVDTTETGLSGQLYTKNELVNKTLAFIQSNLDSTDLTINSLARNILFVRPDYLGKIFKREVGVKLSDYIRNKRIEHAKELLRNGNDRIYEISEKCGFGDNVQHFCYLFKFLTGYTPSQYRGNVSEQETRLGT